MEDFKKLKQSIIDILKKDNRIWNEEKTELNQTLLLDLIDKIDEKLINLLLQEKDTRNKFFLKIKDVYVFKTNEFKFFMEENKVDNSYTQYKNRIGLSDGKRFLKDTNDVVLNFPYKDCVLEGGMTKEDQQQRNEIFFNRILAQDEIDRLYDEKALVNWNRFTKKGKQEVKEIKRDEEGTIRENLIIQGNNLLILHSLKKQFAGKVKLIYIDPPYNTPGDANTFLYNNNFNHSSWLTFMKNRLEIARDLLRQDGVLSVAIDDEEQPYLTMVCNEVFGRENHMGTLVIQNKPSGRTTDAYFATSHEYVLFYSKEQNLPFMNFFELTEEQKKEYKEGDGKDSFKWRDFLRTGGYSTPEERPNSWYSIYYNPKTKEMSLENKGKEFIEILPLDSNGKKRVWRKTPKSFMEHLEKGEMQASKNRLGEWKIQIIDRIKSGIRPKSVWIDSKYDASSHGTKLLKTMFNGKKVFSYPKSIHAVKDIIYLFTDIDEIDIVLDFFAGSGTTGHATLELNNEDGGNRQFILAEQMDYAESVTSKRVQIFIENQDSDHSFIYCELAKWNEQAKEEINSCKSLKELEKLFDTLYEKYFLNYNLKIKEFKEKVIKEAEFQSLSLNEQKTMFLTMLDLNQMYIQKTEMADKRFGIDKKDQKLTLEFYGGED